MFCYDSSCVTSTGDIVSLPFQILRYHKLPFQCVEAQVCDNKQPTIHQLHERNESSKPYQRVETKRTG